MEETNEQRKSKKDSQCLQMNDYEWHEWLWSMKTRLAPVMTVKLKAEEKIGPFKE